MRQESRYAKTRKRAGDEAPPVGGNYRALAETPRAQVAPPPATEPRTHFDLLPTKGNEECRLTSNGVNVMLTLERPPAALLANRDRGERYRLLMQYAQNQRQQIQCWAEAEGLCKDIMRIGEANSFLLLFVSCTPDAAKRLAGAPGVVDAAIASARP